MTTLPAAPDVFHLYDTTLRDGAQQEGLRLTVHDKLRIARLLDELGVGFIEGGWPGANPNDTAFFAAAASGMESRLTPRWARSLGQEISRSPGTSTSP